MSEATGLDSWFLHEKLILSLLAPRDVEHLERRLPGPNDPLADVRRVMLFEEAVATYLAREEVPALEVQHLRGRLHTGALVWIEQAVAFKGVAAALTSIRDGRDARASFSARLATNKSVRIHGTYNVARLTYSTAEGQLSGTKRQFMFGYVLGISADYIELRPMVIAQRWLHPAPDIANWYPVDPAYVWPAAVDQFAGVDFSQPARRADLDVLKEMPEKTVKRAFAEILGEPEIPNDWGGEQFDLWTTSHLSVEGRSLRSAFAFKGPAAFHPMTIATLGKNGDQIERLAHTVADLLVVQHCHAIGPEVVNMLRVYASDPRNPRRYMTIDGYQTLAILRHFGYVDT